MADDQQIATEAEDETMSNEEEEEVPTQQQEREDTFLQYLFQSMLQRSTTATSNEELVRSLKSRRTFTLETVEMALLAIPREFFVTDDLLQEAYADHPLRFAKMGFNISAPHMYAMCLEHLDIQPGMICLDIGSGTGHFTALASYLTGPTGVSHGLEVRKDIIEFSETNIARFLKVHPNVDLTNITFFLRNCFIPDVEERLYDRIHVGACCPQSRIGELYSLLKPGGIIVTPLGDKLIKAKKNEKGQTEIEELASVRYGDLIIPSEAEIKAARLAIEKKRASTVVVPPNTVVQDLINLVNSEFMSDIKFRVGSEGKPIHAHKFLLELRSEHFRHMLNSGMRESAASEIEIPHTPYQTFIDVLTFIYSGQVNINEENALDLLEASNYYKLDRLKCLCEELLQRMIDVDNAANLLQIADRLEARQLKGVCFEFILSKYEEVIKTKAFMDLEKDLLIAVTKEACQQLSKAN